MVQIVEEEVSDGVQDSAEGGLKEVAQPSKNMQTTKDATGTVVVGPTYAWVYSWVEARVRYFIETRNDERCEPGQVTFDDALNMTSMELEDENVKTFFYKVIRHVHKDVIDDRHIRERVT